VVYHREADGRVSTDPESLGRNRWCGVERMTCLFGLLEHAHDEIEMLISELFPQKWHWQLEELFRNLRVRYGIKMRLAGVLTLYVAQAIRLPHDNWAILSVLVMMTGQ
jgi:hypothetical protein